TSLPALRHAVIVGAPPSADPFWISYETLMDAPTSHHEIEADPNAVVEIAFTSGSTGEPKGVMLTANGIRADGDTIATACGLSENDVFFMASTLGHQLGFSVGLRMPLSLGARVVYQEHWNPEEAVELIEREKVTFTCSTPTFLVDLLRARNLKEHPLSSLKVWLLAGAVAPASLHEEAREKLPGLALATVFSMTEVGAVIINPPGAAPDHALATGRAPRGVRLKVIDDGGNEVARGEEGELVIRTHSLFAGYFRRGAITRASFTDDGFFRSGDRVRIDENGYLFVTGRIKDLIKRGGESISPVEIEGILVRHPKVADVAVIGMPDERLGEKVCACVVTHSGETLTLGELLKWVEAAKVAKQKWPERLELCASLPRTSIGKVQKSELRDMVARKLAAEKK
ncbi:MAG: AMP-binding protein, partial [Polyangiaceae bacterium]